MRLKIYVDADACPVQDMIIDIAEETNIQVVLVRSYDHFSHKTLPEHVETIHVDKGADVADFKIIQLAKKHDIVVTQDYGLASLCLAKNCTVLHHKGFMYTHHNIDQLLHTRHMSAMARNSGEKTKGPKPFTEEDKQAFALSLQQQIANIKKEIM